MNLNDEVICGYLVTAEQKRINQCYLDLLREFDRLCKENNLTYYMFFGGLIGSIRHKGFIPWDDDIDLIMPRRDFERLACMTQEQFGTKAPYFLQNPVTDPGNVESLIRMRRSDTTYIRNVDWDCARKIPEGAPYNMGLGLSILPLDNVPKGKLAKKLQFAVSGILTSMLYRAYDPANEKPLRRMICRIPAVLLGYKNFFLLRHLPYRLCRKNRSGMVQVFDGLYRSSTAYMAEDFAETVLLPFEDMMVPAPIGYDRILRQTYGDYMQFPPEEKRRPPHGSLVSCDIPYTESVAGLRSGATPFPEEWTDT